MADNDLSPVCCTRARDFSSRDADIGRSRVDSRFDSSLVPGILVEWDPGALEKLEWNNQPTLQSDRILFHEMHCVSKWYILNGRKGWTSVRVGGLSITVLYQESLCPWLWKWRGIHIRIVASTTIHCCKQVGLKVQSKAWNDVWCQHTQPVHTEGIRVLVEFTCSSCWGGWHDFLLYLLQAVVCYEIAIE